MSANTRSKLNGTECNNNKNHKSQQQPHKRTQQQQKSNKTNKKIHKTIKNNKKTTKTNKIQKNSKESTLKQTSIISFFGTKNEEPNKIAKANTAPPVNCKDKPITPHQSSYIELLQFEMLSEMAKLDECNFYENAVDMFFDAIDSIQRRINKIHSSDSADNCKPNFIDKQRLPIYYNTSDR